MLYDDALSIIRVSDDGQDEELQRTSCTKAAEREGLVIRREIQLHAVSGYKGNKKHLAALADALEAVRSGEVSAVVVAHSSRAGRLEHRDALRWQWDIEDAGGRLVSHDEQNWARSGEAMDDAWSIMTASQNRKKSEDISYHVNRANRERDELNIFRGKVQPGYAIVGLKGLKQLVRHDSAPVVIAEFIECAGGKSSAAIARTFKAECERNGWFTDRESKKRGKYRSYELPVTPVGVQDMIRREFYSTGDYMTNRADGTVYVYHCEPLISPAQQQAAIAALDARDTTGGKPVNRAIKLGDYSGAVKCAHCETVTMYRVYSGGSRPLKDGTQSPKVRRYACMKKNGGCGRTVNADNVDAEINRIMSGDSAPWYIPNTVDPNAERNRRLRAISAELTNLPTLGLDEDDEDDKRTELRSERKRLQAIPDQDPMTFGTRMRGADGRELTLGDRWDMWSAVERRDYLTAGSAFAYIKTAGDRSGRVLVDVELEPDQD